MRRCCNCQWRTLVTAFPRTQVIANSLSVSTSYLNSHIDACTNVNLLQDFIKKKAALPQGKVIHARINKIGLMAADTLLHNTLINMYVKCGNLADARRVFDQMPQPNVCSWTVMIAAYARQGFPEAALTLFHQMQKTGFHPNHFTFTSVLPACANLASLQQGMEIHSEIIRSGFESYVPVANALADMYAKCRNIELARQVFDKMCQRNVVSWTAMIAGYAQNGLVDEALKLFEKMPGRNLVSWTAMISGLAQNGLIDEALKLFMEMPQRNVVSWTVMVAGFARNGLADKALKLFQQMELAGVRPDLKAFTIILPVCANLAALEQGMEIHVKLITSGFELDVPVANALIDMYAKCGSLQKARELFDRMRRRDVVSWTAIIGGYAIHGCGEEALNLFELMKQSGMNPDHVTLLCVLSACSHAGLVDEGYHYFDHMSKCYHIVPTMEHYACIVDLLGRAGHLDEAHDFITKMPMKPDAAVWSCLLGACRIHDNIELGEFVGERILELEPKYAEPYVLLSNIYASSGRWGDIQKIRKIMKDKSIQKTPGCSWIEVNKRVYTFFIGNKSWSQMQHIYTKLEDLTYEMKMSGYVSDLKFLLDDVG